MGLKPRKSASHDIWSVPAYLPYVQPPLTDATIRAAEAKLRVRLPGSYLDLLAMQNGGYVRRTLPDSVHSMIYGLGPHYPSIDGDWYIDRVDDDVWRPRDVKALIPFDGDGHWYLCLDFRKRGRDKEPAVTFVDVELEREREVAPSFASFLDSLEDEDEGVAGAAFGICGVSELEDLVAALESELDLRFEPPSSYDHGYPVARCCMAKDPPEWIWVSPNLVPRGFVRQDDPRHAELSGRMPGTALRMPQRPEIAFFVACTEGTIERVGRACQRIDAEVVSLRDPDPYAA